MMRFDGQALELPSFAKLCIEFLGLFVLLAASLRRDLESLWWFFLMDQCDLDQT